MKLCHLKILLLTFLIAAVFITTAGRDVAAVSYNTSTTWYLAEGSTNGFDTWILIQNPNTNTASVTLTYMSDDVDTPTVSETITVNGNSRYTRRVNDVSGMENEAGVATKVESDQGVIAERAMYWPKSDEISSWVGGHCTVGVTGTATIWYLAEGSTQLFDTYVLIQNPNSTAVSVTLTYMSDDVDTATVSETITISGNSRYTRKINDVSGMENEAGVATKVESDQGVIVERAMYWPKDGDVSSWIGGHCTTGVTSTATTWYLAEGSTSGFNTWVLIQNPNSNTAAVTLTYMDNDGNTEEETKLISGNRRYSRKINDVSDMNDKSGVSTKVVSDIGVIAERAMYWPVTDNVTDSRGGHCTRGVTSTDTTWNLAEGSTSGFDTWVLVQNPNASDASINITYMDSAGSTVVVPATVSSNSRYTSWINAVSGMENVSGVSTKVESTNSVGIIVERAMYWDSDDTEWIDGHVSIGVASNNNDDDDDDDDGEEAYLNWQVHMEPIDYCSPAIADDGTIYIGTHGGLEYDTGQDAKVYAINPDGTTAWTYVIEGEYKPVGGAIVIDSNGHLYFIVEHFIDGDEASDINTYLYSLTSSGTLRWISDVLYDDSGRGFGSHDPAIGSDGTIYAPAERRLYAYNPDGTTKWTEPYAWVDPVRPNDEFAWGISSPSIDSDGVIYVNVSGTEADDLYGIYALEDDGTEASVKWRQYLNINATEDSSAPVSIDESRGRLYVGRGAYFAVDAADSYVYCLNQSNGAFVWKFQTDNKKVLATPTIGSDGTIYFGTTAKPINTEDGVFFAVNPDGTEKWSYDTSPDFNSNKDIYTSAAIGDDGTVYVSSESRYIYAFDPTDGSFVKKYDLYAIIPETSGNSAVVMSSIAIGSDGTLYCGDFYHEFDNDDPNNITHTGALYAIDSDSTGLASTQWPKFKYNNKNISRK